ncbi:MAG: hypothetical protein H8E70_08980 [Candidatus Marinimicrobia bacterium]|nr:hypothetical protein [Candidatus Neomarinimicrobiota bacterium]
MDIQTLLALTVLAGAVVYTAIRIKRNWKKGDADPKCDNCDIKEKVEKFKTES